MVRPPATPYNNGIMDSAAANAPWNAASRDAGSTLAEIIRRIVAAIDPDRIILFGSRARGDARPDSDYDLLVIKDTTERTPVLERAAYRAMKGLAAGVDVLVETPQRVRRLSSRAGNPISGALHEGSTIYERTNGR